MEEIYYAGIFEDETGVFFNIEEDKVPSCPGANLIAIYQGKLNELPKIIEEVVSITEELKQRRRQ
jgi:hypothetical protein